MGRAAGLQRLSQQFDPILSPEYLAVEYLARRAEYEGLKKAGQRNGYKNL
jgi:hypothetical protein